MSTGAIGNWIIAYMPFDARTEFGKGGIVRVHGTINGFPFATSIFPTRGGRHFIMVNKKMQKGAGVSEPGEVVEFTMEAEAAPKKVVVPADLRKALAKNADAQKCFDELPPGSQRYRVEFVTDAQSAERRAKRVAELTLELAELGRAFQKTPDFMQSAFAKSPAARALYEKMSKSHKGECLVYILNAKSQATRDRRVAKVISKLLEKGKVF
ncbi:MAG: hypothetical protein JWO13_2331 [Acidobacteriales bacterium]|nr:hypothetical protein [Terriglobales bacterium]